MNRRLVVVVAVACVVIIALIFAGERLYSNSPQTQDSGTAAQAQGAQSGGSASTYH